MLYSLCSVSAKSLPSAYIFPQSESESEVTQLCPTLRPHGLTIAYQVPPFMGFSRQEYWSGLPFPSPGDLPDPGIEPGLYKYKLCLVQGSEDGPATQQNFCFLFCRVHEVRQLPHPELKFSGPFAKGCGHVTRSHQSSASLLRWAF